MGYMATHRGGGKEEEICTAHEKFTNNAYK